MQKLSENIIDFAGSLPYPLYAVGGIVRDFLSGLESESSDIDICAPVSAEEFAVSAENAGFKVDAKYKNTGTLKISRGEENYEFASFRSDEYVRGEHSPCKTFFTDDILLDARRRDFKCNAVYYDISAGQIIDPLGGAEDIKRSIITTVAPSDKVFGEDGLRLMRLARIAAQTGFVPSQECLSGALNNAELIRDVSVERIFAELDMILHADEKYGKTGAQYRGLDILRKTGVLKNILPELAEGDGMAQRADIHNYDVLEHTFRTVKYADGSIRLAALLHDIGKPYCYKNNGNFYNHETVGSEIASKVCARLKVPKKLAEETAKLVALHMYDLRCDAKENKVRKFIIANYGLLEKLLLLKQADFSACKDDLSTAPSVSKFRKIINDMQKENAPFCLNQLNVRGDDLLNCGIPPKRVGEVLFKLQNDCAVKIVANNKITLLRRAEKVYLRETETDGKI